MLLIDYHLRCWIVLGQQLKVGACLGMRRTHPRGRIERDLSEYERQPRLIIGCALHLRQADLSSTRVSQ
jgi:hypothetical protein